MARRGFKLLLGAVVVAVVLVGSALGLIAAGGAGSALPLLCLGAATLVFALLGVRLLLQVARLVAANRALRRRNHELEAASEAKTRFVANMSHELRNPLNAVLGFTELLRDGRGGPLAARQREHLEIIHGSARHLLMLINDTLDLKRIEAGYVRLDPEPVEPVAIAAACAASLATLSAGRGIHVELDLRPLGTMMLDPVRLRQVVLNYLSNAIKFSPAGGRVTVLMRHRADRLVLEVSDSGPGVDPADQDRVFDEFFQLPGRDRSGSGLGLSVTKLIVEAQGGDVGVRSILGLGSTFHASIPAVIVAPPAPPLWWHGTPELTWPARQSQAATPPEVAWPARRIEPETSLVAR
jgi:signal transduction histidine kinase